MVNEHVRLENDQDFPARIAVEGGLGLLDGGEDDRCPGWDSNSHLDRLARGHCVRHLACDLRSRSRGRGCWRIRAGPKESVTKV